VAKRAIVTLLAVAAALPVPAAASDDRLVLTFAPTNPKAGRQVLVRAVPATSGATEIDASGRVRPQPLVGSGSLPTFTGPVDVYLVPHRDALSVTSATDSRLIRLGTLNPNGSLRFRAAGLKNDVYAAVVSCPSCAKTTKGQTLFVLNVGPNTNGLTPLMLLRPHGFNASSPTIWPFVLLGGALLALVLGTAAWMSNRRRTRAEPVQQVRAVAP
jgi:hypothetical protein